MNRNPAVSARDLASPRSAPCFIPEKLQLHKAALQICCDGQAAEAARPLCLSAKDWKPLLLWLDTSGLALYFLDRLMELDVLGWLPPPVVARLQQNLSDNTERIDAMVAESVAIQRRLQEAGVSYAVLKGFSLWPVSVPKLHLRSQLDHDFLVAEEDADEAKCILEEFGYRLLIKSGSSWEFKAENGRTPSLKDLYKPGMSRQAELHLEPAVSHKDSRLARRQTTAFHGLSMPVLSPADLFLGQGLHVFKHLCSAFSRAAHLVEFHRHIAARRHDVPFWKEIRAKCAGRPEIGIRLGVVIHLALRMLGPSAPPALAAWTVDLLPASVILWIDRYGSEVLLASFPGNKLYLLLERELEAAGVLAKQTLRNSLVPRRLPPVMPALPGESARNRLARRCRQLRYLIFRLWFHTWHGIRYALESRRWQGMRNGLTP